MAYGMFGMPSAEVKLTKHFTDKDGLSISIQSSEKGWVIYWADHSNSSKSNETTSELNMEEAVAYLKQNIAAIAQPAERLFRKEQVEGANPSGGSS